MLAGNPATGESADFPDQVGYAVGTEISVSTRLTLAIDVLGRYVINGERLRQEDFHALDGKSVFPNIAFSRDSFQTLSGALGFKVNVFSRLLIDANLLFALDNNGIRDKLTPLVGFDTPSSRERSGVGLPCLLIHGLDTKNGRLIFFGEHI